MAHNTWTLDNNMVTDALEQYVNDVGYEYALNSITKALPTQELKETLEYIFRMEDYDSDYFEDEEEEEEND